MEDILYNKDTLIKVQNKELKKIIVKDGISKIAIEAFKDSKVEEVILPETLTEIDNRAFYNCTHLEKINLPKNLKSIGSMAFYNTSLKKVSFPENIDYIGRRAFAKTNLIIDNFALAKNIEVKDNAFEDSIVKNLYLECFLDLDYDIFKSVENYHINDTDPFYKCINGDVYGKDTLTLIRKANNDNKILEVENLSEDCFYNLDLENLVIPDTVQSLPGKIFVNCKIKNLTIPKFLKSNNKSIHLFEDLYVENVNLNENKNFILKDNAIYDESLKRLLLYLPFSDKKEFTIPDSVKFVMKKAFNGCKNLEKLIVRNTLYEGCDFNNPDMIPSVLDLKDAFYKTNIKELRIFTPAFINLDNIYKDTKVRTLFLPCFSDITHKNTSSFQEDIYIYLQDKELLKKMSKFFNKKIHLKECNAPVDYYLETGKNFKEIHNILKR